MSSARMSLKVEFDKVRGHFECPCVKEQITNATRETSEWLYRNHQSFDADGSLTNTPWWPRRLKQTGNEILIEERGRALRARVSEHATLRMFASLVPSQIVKVSHEEAVQIGTDPMTFVILCELITAHQAHHDHADPYDTISLTEFSRLFKYSANTKLAKARLKLLRLARAGIAKVRFDGQLYAISIGDVGACLYQIYFETLQRMLPNIEGANPDDPTPPSGA